MTMDTSETDKKTKKHKNSEPVPVSEKKPRKFFAKEFRNKLKTSEKLKALQDFLQNIKENNSQDVALEYLQNNGSIKELLQCMEEDAALPPVLILEIVNNLLLKIITRAVDYKEAAFESCRYFLQNFALVVDKMLGLASSGAERIAVLKFLTTMATNSSHLSKDILTHVTFNLTRIELLSKSRIENKAVRKHFVYFLTALLIEIEYPVLSLLLNTKGLLTSIIPGLIYDDVDTVCFILTAMKNNILENPLVKKTVKMKTFNTIVVKNIVNLYNWKGPGNLKADKGEKQIVAVDEVQKAKVSKCVHDFLMVLCTSHKHGVIFRDPLVGMGKKTQNPLIYTVVDSMDSAWQHSYASELVIEICFACPDITKYIWNSMKVSLEPRFSSNWLTAVDFVKRLLERLKPSCLEPYAAKLNAHQIGQVITVLVAPLPVLKVILPENCTYDLQIVKYHTFSVISSMLKSIDSYITACKNWLNQEQYNKLKSYLGSYIERNFPTGELALKNWNIETGKEEDKSFKLLKYLSLVFDIFENYISLCPELLNSLSFSHHDLKNFLEILLSISVEDNHSEKELLKVQIIDVFLTINPSLFSLDSKSFSFFLSFLFRTCYENVEVPNFKGVSVLKKLLKNTRIFDSARDKEIDVWINGVFGLKSYKENVSEFITASLKLADLKSVEYLKVISEYQESIKDNDYPVSSLSPMILGILEHLGSIEPEKSQLSYLNFVFPNLIFLQNDTRVISQIIKDTNSLKGPILDYVNCLLGEELISFKIPKLLRVLGREDIFNSFNSALISDSFEAFITENTKMLYPNSYLDLLQMGIFYLSKILTFDCSEKVNYSRNLIQYIRFLLQERPIDASIILNNISFIQNFSILDEELNCCTNFIIEFIKCYKEKYDISDTHMQFFNKKIVKMIFKILKNPKKFDNLQIVPVINIFEMNSETYFDILNKLSNFISENLEKCEYKVFYSILVHCLEKYCLSKSEQLQALSKDILNNLLVFYKSLNTAGEIKTVELSEQFLVYFSKFTENIEFIDKEVVNSILSMKEYQKANTDLIVFILKKRDDLLHCIDEKLEDLLFVKGMFYPVLQLLSENYKNVNVEKKDWYQELFRKIYENFEEVLFKTLRKPQKASQHLDENYQGVCLLIELHFQKDKFQEYVSKVLKFELTKVFHVRLLDSIFRKFLENGMDNNEVSNTVLTYVHLLLNTLKRLSKTEEKTDEGVDTISECFIDYLKELDKYSDKYDFKTIQNNESFKTLIKFSLKYGVSDYEKLLQLVESFISLIGDKIDEDQIELIMEMLFSHSQFLDVLLSENHKCKKGILSLWTIICGNWPQLMARSHIPKLLSCYRATVAETDRMIFKLIKMYEAVRDRVSFHDFRPYLWGNAGAVHYSVRIDIGDSLFKQPKIKDVLNILQENTVLSTIKNYHFYKSGNRVEELDENTIYDLEFLVNIFIHLLSPENVVQTYHFARSGALALTILGLSSPDKNMRAASCDVLSRFYFHLEAKQKGKDNLLYMKLITGICVWIADSEDDPMNNFATIFLARTSLILSKPTHIMLPHLSHYLVAKHSLDFSAIPELYTFVHSSDVDFKDHRQFIFEILIDGLITENDFKIFSKSMALKLLTEMYSAVTCDKETKLAILNILIAVCRSEFGVKLICRHSSLVQFLMMDLDEHLVMKESKHAIIYKMKDIFKRLSLHCDILNFFDRDCVEKTLQKIENLI